MQRFQRDIGQKHLMEKVEKDFESGLRSGVEGTPGFFINGEKYDGGGQGELSNVVERKLKELTLISSFPDTV
jgi:protein-disulfide isomerase